MEFNLPKNNGNQIIKVIGVGGGGSNAVNHMFAEGIVDVDFIICNTDAQALNRSAIPTKMQLGGTLTEGLGAGAQPEIGKNAAIENLDDIKDILGNNTKMVFITAGMGGGTGTGAAPIIAQTAKDMGVLTVGIVTIPFSFEGKKRRQVAEEGMAELKKCVDTLIVINNDKLREIFGNLSIRTAFSKADNILLTAAKGIAEIINKDAYINVDFNDVKTVMTNGGTAIMGYAEAEGENRAIEVVEKALASPLLNDQYIRGASQVLLQITSGAQEISMDEFGDIMDFIQEEAGSDANIIFGAAFDETLGNKVRVIIVATGFDTKASINVAFDSKRSDEKVKHKLEENKVEEVKAEIPVPAKSPEFEFTLKTIDKVNTTQTTVFPSLEIEKKETPKAEEKVIFKLEEETPVAEEKVEVFPKTEEKIVHTLDMELTTETPKAPEVKPEIKAQENAASIKAQETKNEEDERTRQLRVLQDRAQKLKEFSQKFPKAASFSDLENEPAFVRRNVKFDNLPHSSQSSISRYTLSENDDKKPEIKPNNPYLHDRAD